MAGQAGRVRLAIGIALPTWSAWPWLTRSRSHASTVSSARGLAGLANQGSNRTVTPPGVTSSTQAWPYQVIVVLPPDSIGEAPPRAIVSGLGRDRAVRAPVRPAT